MIKLLLFLSANVLNAAKILNGPDQTVSLDWSRNRPRPHIGGLSKQEHLASGLRPFHELSKLLKPWSKKPLPLRQFFRELSGSISLPGCAEGYFAYGLQNHFEIQRPPLIVCHSLRNSCKIMTQPCPTYLGRYKLPEYHFFPY